MVLFTDNTIMGKNAGRMKQLYGKKNRDQTNFNRCSMKPITAKILHTSQYK